MKVFKFSKNKYGVELLMDIGTYVDIPAYFFENTIHSTDFYEIVFFRRGNGYVQLDQQRLQLEDNLIVFISPFQKRRWFVNKSKIECYFLFFQEGFLSKFFSDKFFSFRLQYFHTKSTPLFLKPDHEDVSSIFSVLNDLTFEIKNFRSDSEHITRALLYFLLIKLNRTYATKYKLVSEIAQNTIAFKFKQLLVKEIKTHRTIAFYADKLAVSRITLNKSVKSQFGIPVSEMIHQFLLFELQSLLLYSNLSVKEIAYELHFSTPNHLSRFFKSATGQSPLIYRFSYQNGRSTS